MGEIVGDKVYIEMSALSIRSWEVCAGSGRIGEDG